MLEGGNTKGSAADRLPRVRKCAAEPVAAAEGGARAGESAAGRGKSAGPGTALEGGFACGSAAGRFPGVK
jgi:hypothetical protein